MKGILGFLEKTGFVRAKDGETDAPEAEAYAEPAPGSDGAVAGEAAMPQPAPVEEQLGFGLPQVYERSGVPPSSCGLATPESAVTSGSGLTTPS